MITVVAIAWSVAMATQEPATTEVTGWSNSQVAARAFSIVAQHCSPCHSGRPRAPFALRKPRDLVRYARGMAGEVLSERMPPGVARGDFGDFLRHGGLSPEDVSVLWEWSNRNEVGASGSARMSATDLPLTLPPIARVPMGSPTLSISRKWPIPAEAPAGLVRLKATLTIPSGRVNQPLAGFDIDSTTTARLIRVMLMDPATGQMIAAAGPSSRGAKFGENGPRLPAKVVLVAEASLSGELDQVAVNCHFWWGNSTWSKAPGLHLYSHIDEFKQSGTRVLTLSKRTQLNGVVPDFGARAESWRTRVWTPGEGWRVIAEVRSATSKSAGVFNLSRPLDLPVGSKIESRVQYRRGALGAGRIYWMIQENSS